MTDFSGGYEAYRARKAAAAAAPAPKPKQAKDEGGKKRPPRGAPAVEKQIRRLEREIATLEEKLAGIEAQKLEHASDYVRLMELDEEAAAVSAELDAKYEEWGALAE